MDAKTLHTLEYQKVLERLAGYCAFAASIEKALKLQPTNNIDEARHRLAETSEAVQMLITRPNPRPSGSGGWDYTRHLGACRDHGQCLGCTRDDPPQPAHRPRPPDD